jgi:cytochrome c-type biogenesis protein CcmH/NrfG
MENLFPAIGKACIVVVACLFAILVAKSWLFEKSLESPIAFLLICGIFGDAVLILMAWNSPLAYVFGVGGIAGLIALAAMPEISIRKQEREYVDAEVQRLQEMIERDPHNAAAYEFLGDKLLEKKCFDEALEAYNGALQLTATKRDPISGVALGGSPAIQSKMRRATEAKERAGK